MYTSGYTSARRTREAHSLFAEAKPPIPDRKTRKNYGTSGCCNPFLNVRYKPIAPGFLNREWGDRTYNLITQENYLFLRESFYRYAELLGKKAVHRRRTSLTESICHLYYEMENLLDGDVNVNIEHKEGRMYFNLWKTHKWGEYTLYYFPVKFVEKLRPPFRRLCISFLHRLMEGNRIESILHADDTEMIITCLQDSEMNGYEKEERKETDRFLRSFQEGKAHRLLRRVEGKSYHRNIVRALQRYVPQNEDERLLLDSMKEGCEFLFPRKALMDYQYDPFYEEEPEFLPMPLQSQVRVVYDTDDIISEALVNDYNYNEPYSYSIVPTETLALSPDTEKPFTMDDDYPERFFQWADSFIDITANN
ncbi:hypothetical protein [Prevotella sp. HUN102]|uniref:hypothetical protein n=1 Tax=Prevotella sp. HUN102 TaxID=1392486 RepID=UPI00048C33C7|nr:hypothetical protein [Prevotella sp. HUN102]